MTILLPTLAVAFAAFSVWLTLRIVNRRERWAKWTAGVIGLSTIYVLSFAPARLIATYDSCPEWATDAFFILYWPINHLIPHAPEPIMESIRWWLILWQRLLG